MSKLKQVKVNFSQSDYEIIKELASIKNITIAELIRGKFDFSIDNSTNVGLSTNYKRVDPNILYELNIISKDLNKIALYIQDDIYINCYMILTIYERVMKLKC